MRLPVPVNTLVRLASALAIMPVVYLALTEGGVIFTLLISGGFLIAALELITIILRGRFYITTLATLVGGLTLTLTIAYGNPVWIPAVLVAAWFAAALPEYLAGRRRPTRLLLLPALALLLATIGGLGIVIRNQPPGLWWWLLILIATWGTDTLAFAGGRTYGKTPLMPAWSPKKTVEGALTGIGGAYVLGLLVIWHFKAVSTEALLIVLLAPFAAVIGDLLESRLKRSYHVKDSSVPGWNIVPGHGGMLDRIDSLCAVITLVYFILLVIN